MGYQPGTYRKDGGDTLFISSRGSIKTDKDVGAVAGTGVTVVEEGDGILHKTTFTFSGATIALAANAVNAHLDFYTFPAGAIKVLGASVNIAVANTANFEASDNDHFYLGVGTADGSGDLTTTEQNIIAKTDFDTVGGTDIAHDWHAQTDSVTGTLDGTTTAINLRVNLYIPNTEDSGDNTITLTGTLTVVWINMGDY